MVLGLIFETDTQKLIPDELKHYDFTYFNVVNVKKMRHNRVSASLLIIVQKNETVFDGSTAIFKASYRIIKIDIKIVVL